MEKPLRPKHIKPISFIRHQRLQTQRVSLALVALEIQGPMVREKITFDGPIYNLSGQRVDKDYKGIIIVNGKKYLNR